MPEPCIRHKTSMLLLLLLLSLLPENNDSVNDLCGLEVKLFSKNLKHILTWTTPNRKEGIRYSVKYKIYDNDTWHEKTECTNITHNWCDLTDETSDYGEQYYGKVIINDQDCNLSNRFDPQQDIILDPPKVNLFLTNTSITINLTHVVENLSTIFLGLKYEIKISGFLDILTSEVPYYEKEHLDPKTTYCVSARLVAPLYNTYSNFSDQTCIVTKADQTSEETVKIMLCILTAILVIFAVLGAGYCVHKYIHVGNLQQPKILKITSNNNNNLVLVDGHNITINIIKIESRKSNEQSTTMADKEEEKTQVKKGLYFTDDGYDASHDSVVTDDEDHGYVSLVEQVPATRPQVSPYDMPHSLLEKPVKLSTAPSVTINQEEDLYGRIKCNSNNAPIQENKSVEACQKAAKSDKTFTYLPKDDQHVPKLDVLNQELYEESSIRKDADTIDVTDGTDCSECNSLFVDWSPTSHHLYIPNFNSKILEEVNTVACQEEEALLSHLYKPIQIEETSEELACLEQRWGLHVKMQE